MTLGFSPCVELFNPNKKLIGRNLYDYAWVDETIWGPIHRYKFR